MIQLSFYSLPIINQLKLQIIPLFDGYFSAGRGVFSGHTGFVDTQ